MKEIDELLAKYPEEIKRLFNQLRQMLHQSVSQPVQEKLWAKIPTFECKGYIRLIPFANHINIEAAEIVNYTDKLSLYKITPKFMLQIFVGQELPEVLTEIFQKTLID